MKSYKHFLEFVSKNYGSFIFVAVFYSLWIVYRYALSFDPQLLDFPGRMIGEATLNAYDINKRIAVFYRSGLIFFCGIAFFSFIAWRISQYSKQLFCSPEVKIINYTSLAGITFYFFSLWTKSFDSSFELIYCIHKIVLTGFILKWFLLKGRLGKDPIHVSFYVISLVLGVSVFFLLSETSVLFGLFPACDLLVVLYISVVLILLLTILYIRKKEDREVGMFLNKAVFLLMPITIIPVLSFFKDEIYLILNRHEVYYWSPRKLYLLLLLFISIVLFWRYKRFRKGKPLQIKNTEQLLALRYLPLLVVSLATYTFYSPFIELSNEMFEAGNRFLPLMEFQKYGVLPIFEKFNSHVLSELFFGSIYAFFNGMHSREMYIYEFIYQVFWALMVYAFIFRLSRNAYIALFVILFFPLIDTLLFDYTIIALLAVFLTDKVVREEASFRNYFILIFCLAFLLLWRVDIGYPAIIASCVTLLVYLISREQFRINWKLFFKTLLIFAAIVFSGLLFIGWYRDINVFSKLWSGLNYLASAQTYGLTSFGDATKAPYKIQYFVFPLIMILGFGAMLVFYKRFTISRAQRFIYTSFLFLAVYYFVNFQRGLVRHSFIEGHDNGVSSFAFFIFSGSVFLFCQRRSKVFRLIAFVALASFLMMNYKFPAPSSFQNLYSKAALKTETFSAIEPKENIVRCIDTSNYEESHFGHFKKLIAEHLSEQQTFIDFSNLPMLYYFTGKISPSYFYQNPLTIHNDYLQKSFISELSSYDAPFIVFSNFPENWWDNVDGVPNTMRHYRMAEYFYQNYKPFVIVDNLCVWKRNDFEAEHKTSSVFSYNRESDSLKAAGSQVVYSAKNTKGKELLLTVNYINYPPEVMMNSRQNKQSIKADLNNDIDHIAYYRLKETGEEFSLTLEKNENIKSLKITEEELMPDFYSAYPQKDNLEQLSFIWANYDDAAEEKKLLVDLCPAPLPLLENTIRYFNFNPSIDRTSGNMVRVTLETDNEEALAVDLLYGSSKNGFKGSFGFRIPPGQGERSFAVRVSSQYNWYEPSVDYIALISKSSKEITLKKLELLKAD